MKVVGIVAFLFTLAPFYLVDCDVYLHNPRGSNNRLNSAGTNRQNANRLFDSQNNNKGGYNVGERWERPNRASEKFQYPMNYIMSGKVGATYLDIEWTNQHGCGDGDLNCEIVLQYMCQPHDEREMDRHIPNRKRNGISESTIRYSREYFRTKARKDQIANHQSRIRNYGLNEPWEWYDKCNKRTRNKGLFTADQNLNRRHTSRHTRQNPGGTQRGLECPEERDYYPYWHPSDWIDIAVLHDDKSKCPYYQEESFNVKPKGECMEKYPGDRNNFKHDSIHNNEADCINHGGQWTDFSNYLEKSSNYNTEEKCKSAGYKWVYAYRSETIDNYPRGVLQKECVVPLEPPECRQTPYSRSNHLGNGDGITPNTYRWKLPYYPSQKTQRCFLRIRYNISTNDPEATIRNDPVVRFMNKLPLQLAINTAQFGRTFQDRSHMFMLKSRLSEIPDDLTIYNMNIRGKRGNIVQVYPAVEYDFVPKRLTIPTGDAIHVHWTGSNTNPGGNAGQGRAGTDRNNFVEMKGAPYSFPVRYGSEMLKSAQVIHNFASGSKEFADIEVNLASSGYIKSPQDAAAKTGRLKLDDELDNASPSFEGVLMKFAKRGQYFYMCTRNNNFTNRSQKGRLVVTEKRG